MTPKEFEEKMKQLSSLDTEKRHIEMDEAMCELLRELGYHKGVEVFEYVIKWYA